MGTCAAICDLDAVPGGPGSCPDGFTCTAHPSYFKCATVPFAEAGLCDAI